MEPLIAATLFGVSVFILNVRRDHICCSSKRKRNHSLKTWIGFLTPKAYSLSIERMLASSLPDLKRNIFGICTWEDVLVWQALLGFFSLIAAVAFYKAIGLSLLVGVIAALWVMAFPYAFLSRYVRRREARIVSELPAVIEILAFIMEAGLGFDAAVKYVAIRKSGIIPQRFERAMFAIEAGMRRENAYLDISGAGSVELRTAIRSILLSEKQGKPMSKTLLAMASSYRSKQINHLDEAANRLPATMLIPIFLFIVPPILLIYLFPAIVSLTNITT